MLNKEILLGFSHENPLSEIRRIRDKMLEILNMLANLVTSNLVPHKRMAINALLTINVHNRDILNSMVENRITRRDDFEWTRYVILDTSDIFDKKSFGRK